MMAVMRGIVASLGLVGMGWAASACGSSVFACTSDMQCQAGAVAGQCQPSGYCSFPDDACPTGQRYGEAAPGELANACVTPEDGTGPQSTGPAPEDTSGGEPPDPDADGPLESSTTKTETSTTTPVDETTTTDPEPTTGMASQGVTTEPTETCELAVVEPFDGKELAPMWMVSSPPGTEVFLGGGHLDIGLGPTNEWLMATVVMEVPTLAGGWVRTQVIELEGPELPVAGGLVVFNGLCELELYITPFGVQASLYDGVQQMSTPLGDAELVVPIWLQIRQDPDGMVFFEWSADGASWQELASGTFDVCGDLSNGVYAGMDAGASGLAEIAYRSYEHFEACLP